jgi:hypothetical protein
MLRLTRDFCTIDYFCGFDHSGKDPKCSTDLSTSISMPASIMHEQQQPASKMTTRHLRHCVKQYAAVEEEIAEAREKNRCI